MSLTNAGLHNFSSLLEPLEDNVKKCPDKEAFVYIKDSGIDFIPISYAGLFRRVNSISSKLRQFGLEGQCVFLAYPQGIDFVCALFACFHASVKAVPIVIPNNARRCEYVVPIAEVCGAHTLLTISDYVPRLQDFFVQNRKLADLQLIATDLIDVSENLNWINTASATLESIAFIQFTSGSTSAPKGVVLKHDNLLSNHQLIKTRFGLDSDTRFLSWMPHHHDFGLIGHIMQAVYQGSTCYLMAPSAFAHSPKLWLEAITRYRVNFTSSPNFGYQLCVDKISDEQIQHLDLRSWRHGLNGAERVRPSTMKAFYEKFASCGLGKSVQTPIYGLAEGTLIVSTCEKNHDSAYLLVDRESLSKESISLVEEGHPRAEAIANCGKTTSDQSIVIVNPSSRTKLLPYQVGEIWLSGPCVASEYYKLELESETKLRAKLDSSDAESWLRTGDLGFLDGEGDLYVTGRIKELIIIRGQNYYPQDIEVLVEKSHPALTAGCGAAFSVSHNSGEQLVIAYEVKRAFRKNYDLNEIADALCSAIWEKFGLELSAFVLLKPSGVMRTSSGKIQRSAYAVAYENDSFDYLDIWLPKSSARQDHTKTTSIEQTKIEEIEAALTLIWSETLNNDRISRDDKFFMVGGDSLSATTIAAEVRRRFGKELSMEAVLSHPTIRSMARYILEQRQCQTELVTIEHDSANRFERFPLNQIQQAYWLGRSRDIEFGAIGTHLYFEKRWVNFCPDRFSQALNLLIMRHDMLRMVVEDGGWQKVQREVESYVPKQYLLHTFDDTTRKSKLADIRSQLSHQVFDVTKWPLFDIRATRISEAEWIVHFSLDLILMDLGSLFIFFDELCKLYNDLQHELAPLKITFRDHVAFEKSLVDSEQYRKSNDYWLDRLAGFPESARLPINNFSITELQPKFSRLQYTLPSTKWHKIKTKAKEFNLTPSAVFIGAFAWLLKNWSSDDHFALNITLFNRPPLHPDIKKLLGDFTSILLLEVDFSQVASSFVDGLGRIQRQLWNDLDHRLYSGLEFQRQLRSKKGESLLYPIVVSSALGLEEEEQFRPGIEFLEQDVEYSVSQTSQVWLDVQVKESSKGLHFSWDSLDSVFPSEFIKNMFSGFVNFLIRLAEEDDAWFGRFVPGDSEAHVMLSQRVNETDIVFPREGEVLHGPLLRQMNVQGSKPAVITREYTLTFEELDKQSQVLARALVQAGARVNSLVAVYQQRGWRQIVSVLGVLRSGAAYLPISTSFPEERVNKLLDCGDVEIIVCEPELRDLLPSDIKAISLEELQNRPHETREVDLPKIMPTDLAYVIFTSGSTGDPKGVMMEHGACLNTIIDINQRCGVSDSDTAFALSALNFDLSVYDIFGVLGAGGTIIIPTDEETLDPKAWFKYLEQYRITLWNSVPALMQMLLESREPDSILPLRQVLLSGDWIPVDLPARIAQHAPDAKVLSLGGATEAAIWSIYFPVDWQALDASLGSIPYGKPLSNQKFYVLHNDLGLCPVWVEGDLYIGGVGLSRGYWKDNDKTGKSFITHPVSGERLYRTGDRGRLLPDGNIEFLGRLDQQLKIQGFRVEAGEVEAHLKSHPGVNDAVVIARTVNQAKQLVAYIVVKGGDTEDEDEFLADLRAHLERKLPPYMLPECYRIIDKIPLSANGKIDRAALPEPDYRGKARADSGLQNELEKRLASIWARVLKVPISDIDRFSNFFQFGGHSMLAVRLSMDIKRELNRDIAIGRLIRCNTIAKLAAYLSQNPDTQSVETGLPAVERELPAVVPDEAGRFSSFPLNEIQHAYWLGRSGEFTLGNIATHGYYEFQISPKTLEGFEKAWNFLVDRHDMLRVVVTSDATQCVLEPGRYYNVPVSDLSKASNAEIEAHQERTREQMSHQVFDTAQWPLFDIRISRYPGDMAILHVSLDALMLDMSSLLVLLNELNILINRPHIQLDDLQIRFRDYLLAEKELIHTTLYHNSKNYWLARLDDFPDAPALPLAKPPESIRTPRFQRHHFQISGDSWHFIKSRSAEINITPTVIFVTCFAEVLKYWCDSPHFTLNLTQFNRLPLHKQINSVVGDFTSLMLLEMDCRDPNTNFVRRLEQVQKQLWSDLDHRYFDGVEMQRALTLARGQHVQYPVVITSALGLNSLFDSGELGISAEETFELVYGVSQTPQVWLDIQISEQANGLRIDFDSVVDLFPDGMLLPLFEAVIDKLSGLAKDAKAWEDNNYFVSGYAHDALVQRVNNSKRTFTGGYSLLHDPVMDQISRRGNKPAIKTRDKSLSYAELGALSEKLAKRLYINGAKPDQLVAIVLEKGWEEVVSVLGVLRAGAAYLPIDASLPSGRIELLLREGCVKQIVTSKEFLDRVPSDYATTLIHDVVEQPLEEPVYLPRANETDLSYVIFTSGSTGKPKGVMIEHHAALNTVQDVNERFGVTDKDCVLGLSNLSFDLSVYDIFGVLGAGGTLVLPESHERRNPEVWSDLIRRENVTIWNSVPTLMQMFVEFNLATQRAFQIRLVLLSGDWIPLALPRQIADRMHDTKVVSLGGATEASIWSITYPIDCRCIEDRWVSIPYGQALANQQCYVMNRRLQLSPVGVPGNIYIAGKGLARGYWRDQEKTNSSFILHPESGQRLYRTGDRGRLLSDGNIEFLGRLDKQVKVNGYRIELGEIENCLGKHPLVKEAIVDYVSNNTPGELGAYVVLHKADLENEARKVDFKLSQPGVRELDGDVLQIPRDELLKPFEIRQQFDGRDVNDIYRLCKLAYRHRFENQVFPKALYPSGGTLYPVQLYLDIPHGYSSRLPGGLYYYHPLKHQLQRLADSTERDSYKCYLAADLNSVEPIYGEYSLQLCNLEAGYLAYLLCEHGLEFTAASEVTESENPSHLRSRLQLSDEGRVLVCLAPRASGVSTGRRFKISHIQRKSYRHYDGGALSISSLKNWLMPIAEVAENIRLDVDLQYFMHLHQNLSDHSDNLCAGVYRVNSRNSELELVSRHVPEPLFTGKNRLIEDRAQLSFFVVCKDKPTRFALQAAGYIGQLLSCSGIEWKIGVCAIGVSNERAVRQHCKLSEDQFVVHSILAGKVSDAQINTLDNTSPDDDWISSVRAWLSKRLPAYMVPDYFQQLDRMPMGSNGKVDRKALLALRRRDNDTESVRKTRNTTEKMLTEIWRELLGHENFEIHSHFFEVGGSSLLAIRLRRLLNEKMKVDISVTDIFSYSSIASLAEFICRHASDFGKEIADHKPSSNSDANQTSFREIAVIGLACRFPDAGTPEVFWQNLLSGRESIQEFSDDELLRAGVPPEVISDPDYVKTGFILENINQFDTDCFGFSAREAEIMDPQQRLLFECVNDALESSGYGGYRPDRVGLFVGVSDSKYLHENLRRAKALPGVGELDLLIATGRDYAATRIAHKFNFTGPAVSISTACSTSLVAVHEACENIRNGACSMALAGGASVMLLAPRGVLVEDGDIHSPDGRCRTFDAKARGTRWSSGAGIVVLKRLEDAKRDGDNILAVIKGSATNNDGAHKVGFTAPGVQGQQAVIRQALANANVPANTISYIEAHGTGTQLGDPIEIQALGSAFASDQVPNQFCAIGSVKPNIGHLEVAAGIAGLIKTILSLKNEKIPPSINCENLNTHIDFSGSSFFVNTQTRDWPTTADCPRRAGVSSFGIGGTNAHVVLEEAPGEERRQDDATTLSLLVISGHSLYSMRENSRKLATMISGDRASNLGDVAYSLQIGRRHGRYRNYVLASNRETAIESLKELENASECSAANGRGLVFVFPGQGSQYAGMTRELYSNEPEYRKLIDRCAEYILRQFNYDFREILFDKTEEKRIQQTDIAQVILFSVEYSFATLLLQHGVEPEYMVGHSVGEYVAACVAGVFSVEDALFLVHHRGHLMQRTEPGLMLSVGDKEDNVRPYYSDYGCELAAVNSPERCVISGPAPAMGNLMEVLERAGIACKPLESERAFHSSLMEPILEDYRRILASVTFNKPHRNIISTLTGQPLVPEKAMDPEYWIQQLRRPVRFSEAINYLVRGNESIFLEVGPGKTFGTFIRQHNVDPSRVISVGKRSEDQTPDYWCFLNAIGALWTQSVPIDWTAVNRGRNRKRVPIPQYAYDRKILWIDPASTSVTIPFNVGSSQKVLLYKREWQREYCRQRNEQVLPQNKCVFICNNKIKRKMREVIDKDAGIWLEPRKDDFLLECENVIDLGHIIYFLDTVEEPLEHFYDIIKLVQSYNKGYYGQTVNLYLVGRRAYNILGTEDVDPGFALFSGLAPVLSQECPYINVRYLDLDESLEAKEGEWIKRILLPELFSDSNDTRVALRGHYRWREDFTDVSRFWRTRGETRYGFVIGGSYVVTGGLGNIGAEITRLLLNKYNASVTVVDRAVFSGSLQSGHQDDNSGCSPEKWTRYIEFREYKKFRYYSIDILDREALLSGIDEIYANTKKIDGLIHCAAEVRRISKYIENVDELSTKDYFSAKTLVLDSLSIALDRYSIPKCILMSSLASILGGAGYAVYAAANAYLDSFIQKKELEGDERWLAINWDRWLFPNEDDTKPGVPASECLKVLEGAVLMELPYQLICAGRNSNEFKSDIGQVETTETVDSSSIPGEGESIEHFLRKVWMTVLGLAKINHTDSFRDLGGDSLMMVKVSTSIFKSTGVRIELGSLVEADRFDAICALINEAKSNQVEEGVAEEGVI